MTEHQLIQGKPVTTIAGEIDTAGMLESFAIRAVLTIDERTRLLDTAFVSFAISVEGKSVELDLRYRLAGANEPVKLPSAVG